MAGVVFGVATQRSPPSTRRLGLRDNTTQLRVDRDDALTYRHAPPVAAIFQGRLAKGVKSWAREVRYVEESTIAERHLRLTSSSTATGEDVQLWIARGDQPLLQRIVMRLPPRRSGKPPLCLGTVPRSDLNPDAADAVFAFARRPARPRSPSCRAGRSRVRFASTGDKP